MTKFYDEIWRMRVVYRTGDKDKNAEYMDKVIKFVNYRYNYVEEAVKISTPSSSVLILDCDIVDVFPRIFQEVAMTTTPFYIILKQIIK